ncbi:MAG: PKD domain-containing protein [Flavobacteriaceae bacterium]
MHRGLLHKLLFSIVVFFAGITSLWAQPTNDLCSAAQVLTVEVGTCTSAFYTNVAATTTGNPTTPPCWNPATMSNTVWFSFVATTADVEIGTNFGGTLSNTQIAVYSGTCASLNLLACQEDVNTAGGLLFNNVVLHGLTVGNTYYIAVDGNGTQTGTFGICIQQAAPVGPPLPTQDCAGSQTLCNLNNITVPDGPGGVGPTQEWPSCFGSPGERSSNWYSFTAGTSGTLCFTINPSTDIDYDFAVYNSSTGCPGTEIVCNWDPDSPVTGLGCTGFQCESCIAVTAGQTYTILVDRFTAASTSGFTLDFAGTTATIASPNPSFTATTVCLGSPTQFTNTTPGNYTYSWNFGDGGTSNLENPTHTYTTTGPHTVTLLITAVPGGCQNSISQTVTVNPMPTASAGTGTTLCSGACYNLSGSTDAVGYLGTTTFSNNTSFAIPDGSTTGVFSPIIVSGITPTTVSNTTIASVCLDISHTFDGDLDIFLQAPNGVQIDLSSDNGGGGDNYTGTCFSSSATTLITAGTVPFNGSYIPEQAFSTLNGSNVNGTWQLFVRDDTGIDTGTINSWSITLSNQVPAFSWSPITAMTNANTLTPTVCPTSTTTYTLTATNGPGCTTTSSVIINVSGGATANISYPVAAVCTTAGTQVVTLTGTGSYTSGTYSAGAGLSINTSSGLITPSSSTPGPYTITYTIPASGGCPAVTATTTITITAPPTAGTLSGTQNICIGDSVTFGSTVSGGTWTSSNPAVATINAASGAIVGISAGTATMTYTVLGSGGCPNASDVRTITVTAVGPELNPFV